MNRIDNQSASANRPATAEDIRHVLGQVDDVEVLHILAARPTYRELTEAAIWARGDGDLAARDAHDLSAAALAIASILVAAESETQDER
jgi:hypothetical protein